MSYDVRIWDAAAAPLPATLEEAGRQMLAMAKTRPGMNPKFVALAERLVGRHPPSAWLADPVATAKTLEDGVWALEVPQDDRVGALHSLVADANGLGLSVLDEQLGMAFLAGGQVLPASKQALWEGLGDELARAPARVTKTQMAKRLLGLVEPMLIRHGFQARESEKFDREFVRSTREGGSQVVGVQLTGRDSRQYWVGVRAYDPTIQKIIEAACDPLELKGVPVFPEVFTLDLATMANLPSDSSGVVDVESEQAIAAMLSGLDGKFLPALDSALGIGGIHELLNVGIAESIKKKLWDKSLTALAELGGSPGRFPESARRDLWSTSLTAPVVARLAAPKDFEAFLKAYLAFVETIPKFMRSRIEPSLKRLIPYLRDQVGTMAN